MATRGWELIRAAGFRACSKTLPLPKSAPEVGGAVAKNGGVGKRQLHKFSDFRELQDRRTAPKSEICLPNAFLPCLFEPVNG